MTLKPSEVASGSIRIPGGIIQVNDASQYPTHYSDFGFGGLRTSDDLTDRGNIPLERQEIGMLVYVVSTATYFKLTEKTIIDPNTGAVTPSVWEQLQTGGSGQPGIAILEITFSDGLNGDWAVNPTNPEELIITLDHGLGTENLNVDWYQNGLEGVVFVPWFSLTNSIIIGCIPAAPGTTDAEKLLNAFTGLVRISSSVSGARSEFIQNFDRVDEGAGVAFWKEDTTNPGKYNLDVNHKLQTFTPSVEVYDPSGNEQMLCVSLVENDNENIILTVDESDRFTGYVFVKG